MHAPRRLLICKVQHHRQFMRPKRRQEAFHVTKLAFVHSTHVATGNYRNLEGRTVLPLPITVARGRDTMSKVGGLGVHEVHYIHSF